MKNWLYFPMIIMLLASCKNEKTAPEPEPVVLDPVLTLAVSKNTVTTGDTLTVFCKTENAVKTENNIGAPTTPTWKYTFKITETKKIIVSAVNKLGKTVTSDKDVTAVAPYVPTRTDSLLEKSISLVSMIVYDKNNKVIFDSDLSEAQKTNKIYFYKDGSSKGFSSNGTQIGVGSWSWGPNPNVFIMDKQVFNYILNDKYLILSFQNNNKTETNIITYKRN